LITFFILVFFRITKKFRLSFCVYNVNCLFNTSITSQLLSNWPAFLCFTTNYSESSKCTSSKTVKICRPISGYAMQKLYIKKHASTVTALQAHNDLLRTYESKLTQFGIPVEELGFKPLDTNVGGQLLGQAPAGLVSTPS